MPSGEIEELPPSAGHRDGDLGLADLGIDRDVAAREEPALEVERFRFVPALHDQVESLQRPRLGVGLVDAPVAVVGHRRPDAEAEIVAAMGQVVGDRALDGRHLRRVQRDALDRRAEADLLGQRGRLGHQQFGRRQRLGEPGVAGVLAHPTLFEADLFCDHDLVEVVIEGVDRVGQALTVGKNTEPHDGLR